MEISDRPTTLPITHDAFKQRPLRDGGGKPSLGRLAPWTGPLSKAAALGANLCPHVAMKESLSLGDGSHPYQGDSGGAGQRKAFFLDILHSLALTTSFLSIWNKGSHWGSRTHP